MPLVYVHGVANRSSATYSEGVAKRTALFRSFLMTAISTNPAEATVLNPFWGDYGAKFAWNCASFPGSTTTTLGDADPELAALIADATAGAEPTSDTLFVTAARAGLPQAVDLLWVMAMHESDDVTTQRFADLAVQAAAYAAANPQPAWLAQVQNDEQFLRELGRAIEQQPTPAPTSGSLTLGVGDFFQEGWEEVSAKAQHVSELPGWWASRKLMEWGRKDVSMMITGYMGDAMVYMATREHEDAPGIIPQTVLDDLLKADAARTPSDPHLVVVTHSMGGNIVYDILTSWATQLAPTLKVDLWVSVASQVALLEELKLYRASDPAIPRDPATDRLPRPANIDRWLNIFDENDGLAFATAGVFDGSTDYSFSTGKSLLAAHGAYFKLPSFHQRLTARVKELF